MGCLNETVLDEVLLSRFHSVISVIAFRMHFFRQSFYTQSFEHYTIIYSLSFDDFICGNYQTIAMIVSVE